MPSFKKNQRVRLTEKVTNTKGETVRVGTIGKIKEVYQTPANVVMVQFDYDENSAGGETFVCPAHLSIA